MPPKAKRASSAGKSSVKGSKKASRKQEKSEDVGVAAPPTLDELIAAIQVPAPALRTLDSRSGGGRGAGVSKSNGGAVFSVCSHGTSVFVGLLNGLINMTYPIGEQQAATGDGGPTSAAANYSNQRVRTVELAAHGGIVTRLGVVVDSNKPPPPPVAASPASPYSAYGKPKEQPQRPEPKDVLLSSSTDGTVKKWSLPDCALLATYTPSPPVRASGSGVGDDDDEEETTRPLTGLGSRPGTSPAGVNRRRPATSSVRGGIDGSTTLTGGGSSGSEDYLLPINGFALSIDGDTLYAGDDGGYLHIFDFHSGEHRDRIRVHHGRLTDLCVPVAPPVTDRTPITEQEPPRSGCVLTVSDDGFCKLIDPEKKTVHAVFVCGSPIHSLCYRHPTVLTGCGNGHIYGFSIYTAQRTHHLRHHRDSVNRLYLVPEGREGLPEVANGTPNEPPTEPPVPLRMVVSVGDDLSICWWDFSFPVPLFIIPAGHTHNITDVTVDTDGRMHTGCFAGKLRSWDYSGVMGAMRERARIREEANPKPKKVAKPAPKGRGLRR